jgi:hypothetical protein
MTTNFFSPLSFVAVFGSEIRDPGWVKIRIRDKHPGSATLNLTKFGVISGKVRIFLFITDHDLFLFLGGGGNPGPASLLRAAHQQGDVFPEHRRAQGQL